MKFASRSNPCGFHSRHSTLLKRPESRDCRGMIRYARSCKATARPHDQPYPPTARKFEPCYHDGPCMPESCTCVDAGVLCETFCRCTAEHCAYKFTGCGCYSLGKTYVYSKKGKPCICVQLNRECDPLLCGTCGALERADPFNASDTELHATGCQTCDLQRDIGKQVLLDQSQLDGVGYGLYAAENVAQGQFIIEYVGEIIHGQLVPLFCCLFC